MKPTPSELALIAAVLSQGLDTDACLKIPKAFDLWRTANQLLTNLERQQFIEAAVYGPDGKPPTQKPNISLDLRLEQLLPNLSRDWRNKRFHDYLADQCRNQPRYAPWDEAQNECSTRAVEAEYKREGVPVGSFADLPEWAESHKRKARSAAGRKGAAQKLENAAAAREAKKRKRTKPELVSVGGEAALDALAHPRTKKTTLPA